MANKLLPRTDLALEAADTGDHKLPEGVFCEEKKDRTRSSRYIFRTDPEA